MMEPRHKKTAGRAGCSCRRSAPPIGCPREYTPSACRRMPRRRVVPRPKGLRMNRRGLLGFAGAAAALALVTNAGARAAIQPDARSVEWMQWTITLEGTETTPLINRGDGAVPHLTAAGSFLIVRLQVKNAGGSRSAFPDDDLVVRDLSGTILRQRDSARIAFLVYGHFAPLPFGPIAAGETVRTAAVFDVPLHAVGLTLTTIDHKFVISLPSWAASTRLLA